MKDVFGALKKSGQILSHDLARVSHTNERTVATQLQPHIKNGTVMSCRVLDGDGKLKGIEYRISGTIPAMRPGPKIGSTRSLVDRANAA